MFLNRPATASLCALVGLPTLAADLTVEVHGVRSDNGRLYIAVHGPDPESKNSFPSGHGVVAADRQPAEIGTQRFVFRGLPSGRVAATAFHDENGDGALDRNSVGIPTEGYGFLNDPGVSFGPPSFEAASVEVGDTPVTATMTLSY